MGDTEGDVLVAVADPEHVQQLVRTAGDLARAGSGTVRLVTVAVKPHDSPFGVFDDETIKRDFAGDSRGLLAAADPPEGVTLTRDVVVGRSVADGLLAAVEDTDPAALVVGWQGGTSRTDALLGSTVDRLVERAPCALYVERVGREAGGVDSILLPVAGGPHVDPAARIAAAIAAGNDASVLVCSVETPDAVPDAASAFATEGEAMVRSLDATVPVESTVLQAETVADGIADAAADHDVLVLGATRRGPLRRRLVGSVPREVVGRTTGTVILARAGTVASGPLARLGGLLRR